MQSSRNIVNGSKSNDWVSVGICVIVCVQKCSHHFLQTFRPLRMFKIVFRDNSLYLKKLPVFCLLRLISASADPTGEIYLPFSTVSAQALTPLVRSTSH